MTASRTPGDASARLFAIGGALLFLLSLAYGAWCYAWTFATAAGPSFTVAGLAPAAVNVLLFTVFALHHSLFARAGLKRRLAQSVGPALERSVYVWVASALFLALCAAWRPVAGVAWDAGPPWSALLIGLQITGVVLTGRASARLDVLALAGVRQAFGDAPAAAPRLVDDGLYRVVRHPIYFAWVLMVWPAPGMTGTRLTFAVVSTLYLALAIPHEERSLRRDFGPAYERYAARVRWRMIPGIY